MANIKSAKKRVLQTKRRQAVNTARSSAMKTAVKKVLAALQGGKPEEEVKKLFVDVQVQWSRAKGKRVIHANTAARKIGRLAKKINTTFAKPAKKEKAATK